MNDKIKKRLYKKYLNDERNNELLNMGRGLTFEKWLNRERRIQKGIKKESEKEFNKIFGDRF